MEDKEYLDNYEQMLEAGLVKVCEGNGFKVRSEANGALLGTPDLDGKWVEYIKEYIADAVENFNQYPDAAVAWAGFLGIALAYNWDKDWLRHRGDSYQSYYGSRGWDDMDEHVLYGLLGFAPDSKEAKKISECLISCAQATMGLIRHEGIETQTARGFYVLARTYSVFFRLGAALELRRLGYNMVAVS